MIGVIIGQRDDTCGARAPLELHRDPTLHMELAYGPEYPIVEIASPSSFPSLSLQPFHQIQLVGEDTKMDRRSIRGPA